MYSPASAGRGSSAATTFVLFAVLLLGPSLASAATIRGTVVDPDGRAVAAARIAITSPLIGSRETRTDPGGAFRFDGLPAGAYELVALIDGFRADPITVRVAADGEQTVAVRLELSAVSEAVVVTASQIERPLSQTAESLSLMTGDDLAARQIETVADALRLVPGLAVTQNGGRGALTSIFPRGGESDFTLVLIDGIPANLFGGGFDFSRLAVGDVARIEMVRGPQSALFGGGAIGSVVQVVTKHGAGPWFEGLSEGGSFATARHAASTQGTARGFSWGVNGEQIRSDGYTGQSRATGEMVSNDDSRLKHVSASVGWAGPQGDVRARANWTGTERGFPGPHGSNPAGIFTAVDRVSRGSNEEHQVSISASRAWGAVVRTRAQVGRFKHHGTFVSGFGTSTSDNRRSTIRLQADAVARGGFDFSGGTEIQREEAGSTFITGARFQEIPIDRRVIGTFGEARYARSGRLFITGGIRTEHIRRERLEGSGSRPEFADEAIASMNPKISVAIFATPPSDASWTKLRFSAGTGIRAPDAFEIAFTDNPALKPERSRSFEAGTAHALLSGRLTFDATAFFNHFDDLIVSIGRSLRDASRYRTDNVSNARSRGVEVSTGWRARHGLEVRAGYTWMETEILAVDSLSSAPPPFQPGDRLIRRPRHQGFIDAVFARDRFSGFARVKARGRVLDVEPSFGATAGLFDAPGFGVVDLGGSVRAWRVLTVFGRVDNAADRFYEEAFGFPARGRSLTIGLRVASSK